MNIRKTTYDDIDKIMDIYHNAKIFMTKTGNPNQWIDGYPQVELIKSDIKNENSYLCLDENNNIIGTFCFIFGVEPTYANINGKWLNEKPYGVIHRIAVQTHTKNIGTFCLDWALEQCKNIRIDTHRDNIPMQKTLEKNNYQYCGVILWEDGSERIAFQKSIL